MVQTNFGNFIKHAVPPKRAWQDLAHFLIQNYYKKTVEFFYIIHFALSRQWSKLFFGILSSMPDRPIFLHENG